MSGLARAPARFREALRRPPYRLQIVRSPAVKSFRPPVKSSDRPIFKSSNVKLFSVPVILGRRRVQLPSMLVAIGHLVARAQFLVVLILDPQRLADVVNDVLIGR